MDKKWEDLPEELLESVLEYLPIPTLCRFRSVCKKWADLLTQPFFTAKPRLQNSYLFRTPNVVTSRPNQKTTSWEITNTSTQKRYVLDDSFLYDHVKDRFDSTDIDLHRCIIAADNGLLCVLLLLDVGGQEIRDTENPDEEEKLLFVVNPVTKLFQELPHFLTGTAAGYFNPSVAMVVADDMASFKIYVVVDCCLEHPQKKRSFVFESELGAWREFTPPPPTLSPCHVLKVGTILYAIFLDKKAPSPQRRQYELYAYDTVSDSWADTRVPLPRNAFIPQLVACAGRLFFVAFRQDGVSIWEIDLVGKKCGFVVEMAEAAFKAMIPAVPECRLKNGGNVWSPCYPLIGIGANFLALGGDGECIVISSITGVCVEFSLVTKAWVEWTRFGQMRREEFEEGRAGMFGCLMSVNLCPVPAPMYSASIVQKRGWLEFGHAPIKRPL